jgi:hypothetical protein
MNIREEVADDFFAMGTGKRYAVSKIKGVVQGTVAAFGDGYEVEIALAATH